MDVKKKLFSKGWWIQKGLWLLSIIAGSIGFSALVARVRGERRDNNDHEPMAGSQRPPSGLGGTGFIKPIDNKRTAEAVEKFSEEQQIVSDGLAKLAETESNLDDLERRNDNNLSESERLHGESESLIDRIERLNKAGGDGSSDGEKVD